MFTFLSSLAGKVMAGILVASLAASGVLAWQLKKSIKESATLEADNKVALRSIASLEKKIVNQRADAEANARNSIEARNKNMELDRQLTELRERVKNDCPVMDDELRARDDIMRGTQPDDRPGHPH